MIAPSTLIGAVVLTAKGARHASHQQKARDFRRRSPGSDAALGFIVEDPFSYERCPLIVVERRGAGSAATDAAISSTEG